MEAHIVYDEDRNNYKIDLRTHIYSTSVFNSITLESIVFSVDGNIDQLPYIVVDIPELRRVSNCTGNQDSLNAPFAIVHLDRPRNSYVDARKIVQCREKSKEIGSLSSLTIRILGPDGALIDFGGKRHVLVLKLSY